MDPEQLKIFMAAARAGSFSEAARRLFISHSTVSRAVNALEESFGARLFDRGGNAVFALTRAGEKLYSRGEEFFALFELTKDELTQLEKERSEEDKP